MRKLALALALLVTFAWVGWRLLPGPTFAPLELEAPVGAPAADPAPSSPPTDRAAPRSPADARPTERGEEPREDPRRGRLRDLRNTAAAGVRRDLNADEARGGHTIARHVGRTDAQLRERLAQEPIAAASTYTDLATAERVVGLALRRHAARLEAWEAREGPRPNLVLPFAAPNQPPIGRVLLRAAPAPVDARAAVVVLRWRPDGSYVLTSYPELRARGRQVR
jgi:hypothetical protein